jgi:hypothetical protein
MSNDPRQWRNGANVAAIRALVVHELGDIAENVATFDRYRFDPTSMSVDDGELVLKPDNLHVSLPGRWIKANQPSASYLDFNYRQRSRLFMDFDDVGEDDTNNYIFTSQGALKRAKGGTLGTAIVQSGNPDEPGELACRGSDPAEYGNARTGIIYYDVTTGSWTFESSLYLSAAPDATNDFRAIAGILHNINTPDLNSDPQDIIGFMVDRANNASNWICYSDKSGTPTRVDSGIAFNAGNANAKRFKIVYESSPSRKATFYIDDVQVGQITTNLPGTTGIQFCSVFAFRKVAGTTVRWLGVDYVYYDLVLGTAR